MNFRFFPSSCKPSASPPRTTCWLLLPLIGWNHYCRWKIIVVVDKLDIEIIVLIVIITNCHQCLFSIIINPAYFPGTRQWFARCPAPPPGRAAHQSCLDGFRRVSRIPPALAWIAALLPSLPCLLIFQVFIVVIEESFFLPRWFNWESYGNCPGGWTGLPRGGVAREWFSGLRLCLRFLRLASGRQIAESFTFKLNILGESPMFVIHLYSQSFDRISPSLKL